MVLREYQIIFHKNIYTTHITKEIQFRLENERKIHSSS